MRGHKNDNIAKLQSEVNHQKVQVIAEPSVAEDCIRLGQTEPVCVHDFKTPEIE
jgi:hypothetical protein